MPWVASEPLRLVIPGVPRPLERNRHRIVNTKSGNQFVANYLPAQSAREQSVIRKIAYDAMDGRPPLLGAIDLRIVAYMPIPASWSNKKQAAALADRIRPTGRPDWENLAKMLDGLNGVVWRDDSQITDPRGPYKRYSDRPRTVIEIRELAWQA